MQTESRMSVARHWGEGWEVELLFNEYRVSVWKMMGSGDGDGGDGTTM